ncbi:alpha/beta hydrolase fold protein [Mycobacterium tuberculosis]|nr:alpha/beta hydrolase fold protein [Mycobacterium tuberculosis]
MDEVEPARPVRPAAHTVEIGGLRTRVHEAGTGPAVLLLHGSGAGTTGWGNFAPLAEALAARGHRVIVPDQAGFGDSAPPPDGRFGRALWTRQALGVLAALGVSRADVIGNSMGAAIALSLAAARPETIRRVVGIGAMGAPMALPAGLDALWAYRPGAAAARAMTELIFHDPRFVTEEAVAARLAATRRPGHAETFAAMFAAPRQRWVDDLALSPRELGALRQPVLLLHGADDRVVPVRDAALPLLGALPDARLHLFGRCGHASMTEHARPLRRLVLDFLKGHLDHV